MTSGLPTPTPAINHESREFWEAAARGVFLLKRCQDCGFVIWYPRQLCPQCSSLHTEWFEASGRGTIYTFTINRRGDGEYHDAAPYVLAYVELDEGPRVLTNIVADDLAKIAIGDPVEVFFDDVSDGIALYRFRPAVEADALARASGKRCNYTPHVPDEPLDITDPLAAEGTLGRLRGRVAVIVGAGQTPGQNIGNGRATALVFAREGAQVFAVDRDFDGAARAPAKFITDAGGTAEAFAADVTDEAAVQAMVAACVARFGRIDVLHNNVGAGLSAGDASLMDIDPDAFDRVVAVNLKSAVLTCKHVLPLMRAQRSGVVVNVSSFAAYSNYPYIAYKTSKAGVIALTQHVAIANAEYGIRANVLVPGLVNTPMAVENRIGVLAASREEVIAARDAQVPLNKKMGTAWDVAHAALFLASDESRYITGVPLALDGGQGLRIG